MKAAYWGESESLQLLLEANANLNLQNNVRLVMFTCDKDRNPYSFEYS